MNNQLRSDSVVSWVLGLFLGFSFLTGVGTGLHAQDREIDFPSSHAGIALAGTITQPADRSPVALAVLLSVAGPTDRDLSLGPHKYFKRLADGLASKGVATLRFDARGVGKSGGDLFKTDLEDRVRDACQALEALRSSYPDVNFQGFIGMSEGGGIGALATGRCGPVSFLVLLSTPILPGKAVVEGQMRRQLAGVGFQEEQREALEREALRFLSWVGDEDPARNREEIHTLLKGPYGSAILPPYGFVPRTPEARTEFVLSPWYQSQLRYDVRKCLAELFLPILSIYGGLDRAIDPESNAALLEKLAPKAEIHRMGKLNHLMQEAKKGWPMEYAVLPDSISAAVIGRISDWLSRGARF